MEEFTTAPWKKRNYSSDNNSFVFSLNPNKRYKVISTDSSIYGYNYGLNIMFQFGGYEFRITNKCLKNNTNEKRGKANYNNEIKDLIKGIINLLLKEIFKIKY